MSGDTTWRRCSACKNPIARGADYWVCSVSACNRKRTGLVFCSVSCWEVHLPVARHREAWAVEARAPSTPAVEARDAPSRPSAAAARERTRGVPSEVRPADARGPEPREVLIIASRLKEFVRSRSGFNTSDRVLEPLSDIVRDVCEQAIRNAEQDGRKTVLDRDVPRRRPPSS